MTYKQCIKDGGKVKLLKGKRVCFLDGEQFPETPEKSSKPKKKVKK